MRVNGKSQLFSFKFQGEPIEEEQVPSRPKNRGMRSPSPQPSLAGRGGVTAIAPASWSAVLRTALVHSGKRQGGSHSKDALAPCRCRQAKRGAHAPRVWIPAPRRNLWSAVATLTERALGEAPKAAREGACAPLSFSLREKEAAGRMRVNSLATRNATAWRNARRGAKALGQTRASQRRRIIVCCNSRSLSRFLIVSRLSATPLPLPTASCTFTFPFFQ